MPGNKTSESFAFTPMAIGVAAKQLSSSRTRAEHGTGLRPLALPMTHGRTATLAKLIHQLLVRGSPNWHAT
ncbi:MAG: hypothetical protein HY974_01170 [Candidatus Kerfeldbacteria bacterium]|nr:hypothetical protein [Candidatus Kerfeldbacteria bacterium]